MQWTLILLLGSSLAETTWGWTYHYSNTTMTWAEARKHCTDNYKDMVVIQSQEENDFLVSLLPNRTGTPYYWIGITKTHMNETWTWLGNNSTWIGNESWAENEPNNNYSTEFCVEIYVNIAKSRGKWNDEKCSNKKYPVCYKAQCNDTACGRGTCRETINSITCHCEPGFKGDRCQTAVECPHPPQSDNRDLSCSEGKQTFNSTCQLKCHLGFMLTGLSTITCGANGDWSGPRPICTSYKHALLAVVGCGALSAVCCVCCCWMKRRKSQCFSTTFNRNQRCNAILLQHFNLFARSFLAGKKLAQGRSVLKYDIFVQSSSTH
ncbi:E-selectin-like [Platichthys flesus]|uniref:E-selectin-like n=1 Tax=Platichthys flesus TaxID=8260 RepID=UPI002DBA77F6|nr:E-selectin-like [Platichthys flesus]